MNNTKSENNTNFFSNLKNPKQFNTQYKMNKIQLSINKISLLSKEFETHQNELKYDQHNSIHKHYQLQQQIQQNNNKQVTMILIEKEINEIKQSLLEFEQSMKQKQNELKNEEEQIKNELNELEKEINQFSSFERKKKNATMISD